MPQLIVRKIENQVVSRLRQKAAQAGVSMEEEHRRILRKVLLGDSSSKSTFKAYLTSMPDFGDDKDFERIPEKPRKVNL